MNRYQLLFVCGAMIIPSIAVAQGRLELPDRPITRAEVHATLDQQFKAMDANHDGKITPDEFQAYRAKQEAGTVPGELSVFAHVGARWFEKNDANGDGVVTPAETSARVMKMFDMADTNRDGVISLKERQVALAMMALRHKGHGSD